MKLSDRLYMVVTWLLVFFFTLAVWAGVLWLLHRIYHFCTG